VMQIFAQLDATQFLKAGKEGGFSQAVPERDVHAQVA
jgi:hypothetical protein